MSKISYKLWKSTFPYICTKCGSLSHQKSDMCEYCGKKNTLRESTKKDYKSKYKKVKTL